jgi:1,4-alpha-glucan branching enzyme
MGANPVAGGATFKVWGPSATSVYVNGTFQGQNRWSTDTDASLLLSMDGSGYWTGFLPGVAEGDQYKYYVIGAGSSGYKRDPYARELTVNPAFPDCNCVVRSPNTYPWHDSAFVTPDFSNMIVYQLHVGVYSQGAPGQDGTFLDVIGQIQYLQALGINVLQPLPVDEFETQPSMGYNGADYFSPDSRYGVTDPTALGNYLTTINGLLAQKDQAPLTAADITPIQNQLKALVDLCHLYGIAVVFDVVYNHAGGFEGDDDSIFFWDREVTEDNNNSLYFTDQGYAGGLGFALWKQEVQQFLIDNTGFYQQELHADGFRYDEISALVQLNSSNGWAFCQSLTGTVRYRQDRSLQNAEYWPVNASVVTPASSGGAGFDTTQHDALRLGLRQAIGQASGGMSSFVSMDGIAAALYPPGFPTGWSAVPCVENHDVVYVGRDPRIPELADSSDPTSFYARSRSRVAMGILMTVPGIPQIFMGQEFLESQQWSEQTTGPNLLDWADLRSGIKPMSDFLRYTQDIISLRWNQPAIRGNNVNAFHVHDTNRIVAYHRWLEGTGQDVIVVASLNDNSFYNYSIGFPFGGHWNEIFNGDVYDNWVNPLVVGNAGGVDANGGPMHGFNYSASIVIPPNSLVIFTQ